MASEGQETVSKSSACTLSALWCSVLCYRNPIAFPYYARPRFSWSKNCFIGRIKFSFELEDLKFAHLFFIQYVPTLLTVSVHVDLLKCRICNAEGSLSLIIRFCPSLSLHNVIWGWFWSGMPSSWKHWDLLCSFFWGLRGGVEMPPWM